MMIEPIPLIVEATCRLMQRGVQMAYNHKRVFKPIRYADTEEALLKIVDDAKRCSVLLTDSFLNKFPGCIEKLLAFVLLARFRSVRWRDVPASLDAAGR